MAGAAATRLYQLRNGIAIRDEWPDRNFNVGVGEMPPFKWRAILCNIFPRNWSLFIAVLEMIRSLFCISFALCRTFLVTDYSMLRESPSYFIPIANYEVVILLIGETELTERDPAEFPEYSSWRYMLFCIVVLFSLISIMSSMLLWRGAKLANPSQLRLWFIYKFFMSLILIPLHAVWLCSPPEPPLNNNYEFRLASIIFFFSAIFSYLFTVYSLFVVFVLIQEIWSILDI